MYDIRVSLGKRLSLILDIRLFPWMVIEEKFNAINRVIVSPLWFFSLRKEKKNWLSEHLYGVNVNKYITVNQGTILNRPVLNNLIFLLYEMYLSKIILFPKIIHISYSYSKQYIWCSKNLTNHYDSWKCLLQNF